MRALILLASVLVRLTSAAPRPQDIDFDLAYALPNPTYSTVTDATAQIVSYNPTTVFSAASSQITATDTETALDATIPAFSGVGKRSACATQPVGHGARCDSGHCLGLPRPACDLVGRCQCACPVRLHADLHEPKWLQFGICVYGIYYLGNLQFNCLRCQV